MNGAVVFDVNLSAGFRLDGFDVFAARSDEFADAIRRDFDGNDARRVGAELFRLNDGLRRV
jgi:hypothetical protein